MMINIWNFFRNTHVLFINCNSANEVAEKLVKYFSIIVGREGRERSISTSILGWIIAASSYLCFMKALWMLILNY